MAQTQTTSVLPPEDKAGSRAAGTSRSRAPNVAAEPPNSGAPGDPGELPVANLVAMAQAGTALIHGFEAIGAALYAYVRGAFSSATSAARSMIDARSLADVVAVNHDFAQTALEELISSSARVAEIGARATGDALRPIGTQVAETVAKLNRPPRP